MAIGTLALLIGCGSKREVTGTLLAAHPAGTRAVATGSYGTSSATVASDGRFALAPPSQGTFRVRFVAPNGGRRAILGTVVGKSGRPASFRSDGRGLALGEVGRRGQALEPADGCAGDGEGLDAQGDVDQADAGEEDEHDDDACEDGEHDGGDNDDGEHDGGHHHDGDHDGGHHGDDGDRDGGHHGDGGDHDGGHHDDDGDHDGGHHGDDGDHDGGHDDDEDGGD
jgi:hypothetical protein